jgi:hypothetical protein
MIKINIQKIMSLLSKKRPVFHSEFDFQFALAWEIQKEYKKADIRLEYRQPDAPEEKGKRKYFDIKIELNEKIYLIELKYKTIKQKLKYDGELYELKNHAANPLGRYLYLKDIQRIEDSLVLNSMKNFEIGYAILLTIVIPL